MNGCLIWGKSLILLIVYMSYSQHVFMYIILLIYFNVLAVVWMFRPNKDINK